MVESQLNGDGSRNGNGERGVVETTRSGNVSEFNIWTERRKCIFEATLLRPNLHEEAIFSGDGSLIVYFRPNRAIPTYRERIDFSTLREVKDRKLRIEVDSLDPLKPRQFKAGRLSLSIIFGEPTERDMRATQLLEQDPFENSRPLRLSRRQKQVLIQRGNGLTSSQIAEKLGIDLDTVQSHFSEAYFNLDVKGGVIPAITKALSEGAIDLRQLDRGYRIKAPHVAGRKLEVLRALARGMLSTEICEELGIEYNTLRTHISELNEAFNSGSRVLTLVRAFKAGIIDVPGGREREEELLTTMELETAKVLAQGLDYPQIMAKLGITHTALNHRVEGINNKLGLRGQLDIALYLYDRGEITLAKPGTTTYGFTNIELGILKCTSRGLFKAEIQKELQIGSGRYNKATKNILKELEVSRISTAAVRALYEGLIPVPERTTTPEDPEN